MGAQLTCTVGVSDFHEASPPSPQACGYKTPKPITLQRGVEFNKRSVVIISHHSCRKSQHCVFAFTRAHCVCVNVCFFFLTSPPPKWSIWLLFQSQVRSIYNNPGRVWWHEKSSWRMSIITLLYAFSLFTVLPCLIMFKQHCTGLWQHRELCGSGTAFPWPRGWQPTNDIIRLKTQTARTACDLPLSCVF